MHVFEDLQGLGYAITAALGERPSGIISVDGFDRVGKSYVSLRLAERFNAKVIELDDMWLTGSPTTRSYDILKAQVEKHLLTGNLILLDGVMINDELKKLNLSAQLSIYVKAIAKNNCWVHEEWLTASSEEVAVARAQGIPIGMVYSNNLIVKNRDYHCRCEPHLYSDFIYLNRYWD